MSRVIVSKCEQCGFSSTDYHLVQNHSCEIQQNGGHCEDYPACGHEYGDCNGQKYGSDESIKAEVEERWRTGHGYCEHAAGIYNCDDSGEYDEEDDE